MFIGVAYLFSKHSIISIQLLNISLTVLMTLTRLQKHQKTMWLSTNRIFHKKSKKHLRLCTNTIYKSICTQLCMLLTVSLMFTLAPFLRSKDTILFPFKPCWHAMWRGVWNISDAIYSCVYIKVFQQYHISETKIKWHVSFPKCWILLFHSFIFSAQNPSLHHSYRRCQIHYRVDQTQGIFQIKIWALTSTNLNLISIF